MLAKTPRIILHPKSTQSLGAEEYKKSHEAYIVYASKTGATCQMGRISLCSQGSITNSLVLSLGSPLTCQSNRIWHYLHFGPVDSQLILQCCNKCPASNLIVVVRIPKPILHIPPDNPNKTQVQIVRVGPSPKVYGSWFSLKEPGRLLFFFFISQRFKKFPSNNLEKNHIIDKWKRMGKKGSKQPLKGLPAGMSSCARHNRAGGDLLWCLTQPNNRAAWQSLHGTTGHQLCDAGTAREGGFCHKARAVLEGLQA